MTILEVIAVIAIAVFCSLGISVTFVLARIGLDYVRGSYKNAQQIDGMLGQREMER